MEIVVCEVLLRDGLQSWPTVVDTDTKVSLIEAAADAGIREIDVTSFVPARVAPQFADATEVLSQVPSGVAVRVLAPNPRGVDRVILAHRDVHPIDYCGMPISASEPHNIANLRRNHAEHREQLAHMIPRLLEEGIQPLVAIATAFGCPIAGDIEPDAVLEIAEWLYAQGVRRLMFGDTTGMADPGRVERLYAAARARIPGATFVAHFHDNRGVGIANTLAAVASGAAAVDASLGGLGGEPSSVDQGDVGESGNVATEDLVAVLARLGVSTGIEPTLLLKAGKLLETAMGRQLHSKVMRAGLISQSNEEGSA